jgi:lipopolysaccharide biosynthesis glycosyltransferase
LKKVIVGLSDKNYIKHFTSLVKSARIKGKWDGDFVLIMMENDRDVDVSQYKKLGVNIFYGKSLPSKPPIHFYKFYLFESFFSKWDWIFFVDMDVLFLNKIDINFDNLNVNYIYTKKDGLPFMNHFYGADDGFLEGGKKVVPTKEQQEEKKLILEKYGNGNAFQTCFLLFNKKFIQEGYFDKLKKSYIYYYCYHELARNKWWDQSIFNLVFYKKWLTLDGKFNNRNQALIDVEWKLDKLKEGYYDNTNYDNITALHFFSFFPPWDENNLRFYPIYKNYLKD